MMETKKNWTPNQILKFRTFHNLVKRRLALGESEESAYRDKPEGYSEWAKEEFKEHGGVKLPTAQKVICINPKCKREFYPSERCPFCGMLTVRRRS
jgi:hypothetical protein